MENRYYRFECECGAKFFDDEPNKFNAHKSHCKIHLGPERWQARIEKSKRSLKTGSDVSAKHAKELRDKKLAEWIAEQHHCEHCGKLMTEKYGSGRFCCEACAHSREITDELKARISTTVHKTLLAKENSEIILAPSYNYYKGFYKDIYCASSYEFLFLYYCLENNINIERCKYRFEYEYKGKLHVYFPDFYLPDTDEIIELKGHTEHFNQNLINAKAKAVTGHNYKIIYDKDIEFYQNWVMEKLNLNRLQLNDFILMELGCVRLENGRVIPKPHEIRPNRTHEPRTKGYIWVCNHELNKSTLIKPEMLETYLTDGWVKGHIVKHKDTAK